MSLDDARSSSSISSNKPPPPSPSPHHHCTLWDAPRSFKSEGGNIGLKTAVAPPPPCTPTFTMGKKEGIDGYKHVNPADKLRKAERAHPPPNTPPPPPSFPPSPTSSRPH